MGERQLNLERLVLAAPSLNVVHLVDLRDKLVAVVLEVQRMGKSNFVLLIAPI